MSLPEHIEKDIGKIKSSYTQNAVRAIAGDPLGVKIEVLRSEDDGECTVYIGNQDAMCIPLSVVLLVCKAQGINFSDIDINKSNVINTIVKEKYVAPTQQQYLPSMAGTAAIPTSRVNTTLELENNEDEQMSQLPLDSQLYDDQSVHNDETQQHDAELATGMGRLLQNDSGDENLQSQSHNSESLPPPALPSKLPPPQPPTQNQTTLPSKETTAKSDKPQRTIEDELSVAARQSSPSWW